MLQNPTQITGKLGSLIQTALVTGLRKSPWEGKFSVLLHQGSSELTWDTYRRASAPDRPLTGHQWNSDQTHSLGCLHPVASARCYLVANVGALLWRSAGISNPAKCQRGWETGMDRKSCPLHLCFLYFLFYFVFGATSSVLNVYLWLWTQGSLLVRLGYHMRCQVLNPSWPHVRPTSDLLYYCYFSLPFVF